MNSLFNFIFLILLSKCITYSHEIQKIKNIPFQNVENYSEKLIILKLNKTFLTNPHEDLHLKIDTSNNTIFINDSFKTDTRIVWSSHVALVIIKCIFLSFMILLIIIGNALVILTVLIVKKFHTKDNANNLLIVSLSISDLLVGVLVLPLALYIEIKEGHRWDFSAVLCDLWTLSDVLLCTASILNLVAISIDRYLIIQHSFGYTQKRNPKLMLIMILCVWLLSALISIPPLFGWGRASKTIEIEGICLVSQDFRYQIYATLLAFYLPLIVMIILNIIILRTAKKLTEKEMKNCVPVRQRRASIAALIGSIRRKSITGNSNRSMSVNDSNSLMSSSDKTRKKSRITIFQGIKRESKTSDNKKKDKAAKTLGIIMGLFTVCWLPFFILALLKPIPLNASQTIRDFVPEWLDSLLLWLGYSNSALNPIIYAQFNKDFRRPFIELLCFRCCSINKKLRDIERKRMYADESVGQSKNHLNRNISDYIEMNQMNGATSSSMV